MRPNRIIRTEKFSPSEELADAAMATAVMAAGPGHVLVVEDDPDCSLGLSIWLERMGHAVASIDDGAEAIDWIERHEPALVLLDLGLPGMHGLKVLHEIRMRRMSTRVVVLTAVSDHGTAAKARALGAYEVLHKPVDKDHLLALLDELLPDPEQENWRTENPRPASSRTQRVDDPFDMAELLMTWARQQGGSTPPEVR